MLTKVAGQVNGNDVLIFPRCLSDYFPCIVSATVILQ